MRSPGSWTRSGRLERAALPVLFLVLGVTGCATGGGGTLGSGGSTTGGGGSGAGGATTTATTGGTGGAGGTATGGDATGGNATGGGGSGGTPTTSSTTPTTSSTTTSTGSGVMCADPVDQPGLTSEVEPNALAAIATTPVDGTTGFLGSICPPGDIDVLAIPVSMAGASLRLEIQAPMGGCPVGAKPYLRLFDANGVLVAKDEDSGSGWCSLIAPEKDDGVVSLAAGTYYAQIENLAFTQVDAYVLALTMKAPGCGDGVVQAAAGEQCDDGNVVSGDGCSATCLVEAVCGDGTAHFIAGEQCDDGNTVSGDGCSATCQLEAVLLVETEPNPQGTPNSLAGYDGAIGAISPAGDTDWYSFEVTVPGSNVTVLTSDGLGGCPAGADTQIFLYDAAGNLLAQNDEGGAGQCSLITPVSDPGATGLAVGTYKVKVEDYGNNQVIGMYVLTVHVAPPGCGDSLLQMGEQCDDGNVTSGDGCSDLCLAEAPWEIEPNDMDATATPEWPGYAGWNASIQPDGDIDWFAFNVQAGQSVALTVHASGAPGTCPQGFDSVLYLLDGTGALVVEDDDDGPDTCSMIIPALDPEVVSLPAGTYYARVEPFGGTGASGPYQLDLVVQ